MTEIDVDMAICAIAQAATVLATAVRDTETRGYVEANRELLLDDIGRLSDILAVTQDSAGTAVPRPGGIAAKRTRSSGNLHYRRPVAGTRGGSRSSVG